MTSLLAASEDIGKAGPVGLFLILSLLIVVFLLGRSMRNHLRRVPFEFPDSQSSPPRGADACASDGGVLEGEILDPDSDRPGSRGDGPDEPGSSRRDSV